jgi:site-specific DNA-methyltransferase (adenine-specific)
MTLDNIYNMDCLEGMKQIPDGTIDAVICDLPYGTTANKWDTIIPFDKLWEQYHRITKPTSPIILFGAEPFTTAVRMSNIKEYHYDWIW